MQAAPGLAAEAGAQVITTEVIQQYLDENQTLILAILENQNAGKLNECAQYQQRLQQNLMYLAALADSHSAPAPVPPQGQAAAHAGEGASGAQPEVGT